MHTVIKSKTYFVTGIGTDVGKTVVSAILVEALQADYWKPIQSGSELGTDSEFIKNVISNSTTKIHTEIYNFKAPLSPHAAAELENTIIDTSKIIVPKTNNNLIIEGAGGLMVPITENFFVIDLIQILNCEVILITRNYLGSINHTLLSAELLKARNIKVAGIIINGDENKSTEKVILQQTQYKFLGRINEEKEITKAVIEKYAKAFNNIIMYDNNENK